MSRSVALYPGSFDPVTLGHADLIRRGAALFDELVVAVGVNPAKRSGMFDGDERIRLIESCCGDLPNVRVTQFHGLMVDAASREGATVVLRGLRSPADFGGEFRNGLANRDLTGIETLFLLTDPRYIHVSSSLVKEIATNGGRVAQYVPPAVDEAIRAKVAAS